MLSSKGKAWTVSIMLVVSFGVSVWVTQWLWNFKPSAVPAPCPTCPVCQPTKSGAATTKGTQSPAITGSGNPVNYGTPPPSEPKKTPQN